MLKRHTPLQNDHLYLSDSETETEDLNEYLNLQNNKKNNKGIYVGQKNYRKVINKKKNTVDLNSSSDAKSSKGTKALKDESDAIVKKAKKYQEYMKKISIPSPRGLPIPFNSWQGLGKSMKQIYEQPLHYSTHDTLKQWDQLRIGRENESKPLDQIIHPSTAEATIWGMEEVHRQCTSHQHLAKLWHSDPLYHDLVDPIIKYGQ